MSIQAKFKQDRHNEGRRAGWFGFIRKARDSNRQRCYDWENQFLRLHQRAFTDRQAAKGYARLLCKVAIKTMIEKHGNEAVPVEAMRASFQCAFTQERSRTCWAWAAGCYFGSWGWTDVIIAHEVAHWADHWEHRISRQASLEGHGPKWRGWFIHLLADTKPLCGAIETDAFMQGTMDGKNLKYTMPV